MSNILIIKHGSLGDIVQISGVLRDIRETHNDKKIFILTTALYAELLSICPFIDFTLIDNRHPRWNIFYLIKLKKMLNKYNFTEVYDLQNSSRTNFYRRFLLNSPKWCCSVTSLDQNQKKSDYDNDPILERFKIQLNKSGIKTKYTLKPDFSWAAINIDKILNKYFNKKFIILFPFCSPQLPHKKWPYFNDLIKLIKKNNSNFEIITAPTYSELKEAEKLECKIIMNNNKQLSITELAGLIKKSSYVIANDTGPAHIAAHLGKNGVALFGYHTTAKKVSIETNNFKVIKVDDLRMLNVENVYSKIKDYLNSIN